MKAADLLPLIIEQGPVLDQLVLQVHQHLRADKVPGTAGGGTLPTTARMLPEAAVCGADPEPRKCRLRTSKRNFAGTEALAYPQTVSVTEGEHLPGGRCGHSVHIADRGYSRERSSFGS